MGQQNGGNGNGNGQGMRIVSAYLGVILAAIGIFGAVFAAGASWASVAQLREKQRDTEIRVTANEGRLASTLADIREIKVLLAEIRRDQDKVVRN